MTDPRIVAAMSRPDFYPHRPSSVEVVQTHISYVFIAGELVYKLKKAVDFGFLDFTTLEKRRENCLKEVNLNRRLAPDTYLGVAEIGEGENGEIVLGAGRTVEYAVKMKKLPKLLPQPLMQSKRMFYRLYLIWQHHHKIQKSYNI